MFAQNFGLQIVTPEGTILKDLTVDALIVPSSEGLLGILPNHAPMVAALKPGVVRYKQDGQYYVMAVGSGFLEIAENKATILVDTAEPAHEIDPAEARRRYEHLMGTIGANAAQLHANEEHMLTLEHARARVKAAEIGGSSTKH